MWRACVVRTMSSARAFSASPIRGELRGRAVGERPWRQPFLLGRALHLLAVLVHAGDKQHVIAVEPLPSGEGVGGDALIGVADMRRAIRIGNGRRDHVRGTFRHGSGLARFGGAGKRPKAIREMGRVRIAIFPAFGRMSALHARDLSRAVGVKQSPQRELTAWAEPAVDTGWPL